MNEYQRESPAVSGAATVSGVSGALFVVLLRTGLAGLGVAAFGLLIAAVFSTDPATTAAADQTWHGRLHILGASLDYTPVAALLVSFGLARHPAWRPVRARLFATAGLTLLALAAFMATLPYDGVVGPDSRAGLFGRILLVSYVGWLSAVALHVRRLHRPRALRTGASVDIASSVHQSGDR
jgi:hypothetical protein